jgi:TolB-like protein/Tfp pilus assembly protein PilF
MKQIRMLAAIMFTDMVGYSTMMQEDEVRAKILRDKHRTVLDKYVSEHHGQILQYYGDGTLSIFGSAIEAAMCGAEIQKELQTDPLVPLRIGIHAGDIVYDDEGVYGDSVNIASRIENIAIQGSVLISDKINDELKNQKELSTVRVGRYELKNIRNPVEIFAINFPGIYVPSSAEISAKSSSTEQSIAVLPFVNLSSDKDNDYFSDGITEELLNALAKVEGLMVTSRTSSFAFKGKNSDIREIGKQLGVKTVLEGSVRKYGNRVRVTAQLINADNGYHKWSETYDRDLEDIFKVQDDLALSIVDQLKKTLSIRTPSKHLVKIPTENIEAYNIYLKALYYWNKWTPENVYKAIQYCEESIKLAPDFAMPYARISACYIFLGATGAVLNKEAYPKSKHYAHKSLELDDTIPNSHLALAMVQYFNDWDWQGAEQSMLKALELNPNFAEAHLYYSTLLSTLGNYSKALKEAELAFQLDPLNPISSYILAYGYFNNNRLDEALAQHQKTKEIDPDFGDTWNSMAWVYVKAGEYLKAKKIFEERIDSLPHKSKALSGLGYIHARLGEKEKTLQYLDLLKKLDSPEMPMDMDLAITYLGLEDYDKVFSLLESACEKKLGGMNFINGKYWKEIHDHPRFKHILEKMKLPTH